MKILDKYIAKNFLIGYAIAFCVLLGLRAIIDLFVNLDEFTEHANLTTVDVLKNILIFYGLNCTLYFRDFAGMITVLAAVFSLGKMVRSSELVVVMASGVSLKRVLAPILLLSALLTGLFVIDQEIIIPKFSRQLVRNQDDIRGEESYKVNFLTDGKGSLIFAPAFDVKNATFKNPTIVPRTKTNRPGIWEPIGRIDATEMTYDKDRDKWILVDGRFIAQDTDQPVKNVSFFETDLKPEDIPVRLKSEDKSLLSSAQLSALAAQKIKIKDTAQLYSQKHFHITEPVFNFVMLLVCLPVLVCRDPKAMKTAVMLCFALVGLCLVTIFGCKMLATEVAFSNRIIPEFWAWLPIFLFGPVAFLKLDSMKT